MKKFNITVTNNRSFDIEVFAETADKAMDAVSAVMEEADLYKTSPKLNYDLTEMEAEEIIEENNNKCETICSICIGCPFNK